MSSKSGPRFPGVLVAATTPFDGGGAVDLDAYAKHCAFLVEGGVAGVIPNGSLGEYETLTDDERASVMRTALETVADAAEVIPGVSGKSAAEARRWTEVAAESGCRAVMALPPTSHAPTDDEVVAHFAEIARVGLPIIAYNNPYSTRVDLRPRLLARMAEIDEVAGVKEFSQDVRRVAQILELAPRLEVICGCDDVLVEAVLMGATGWIAGFANAFPRASVRLFDLAASRRFDDALVIYRRMLPALRFDADPSFVQAIKLAQDEAGRYGGPVRLPRLPLSPELAAEVRRAVRPIIEADG